MNTRITVDLGNPQLLILLRMAAAQEARAMKELIIDALENYLSNKLENQALLKLAEGAFAEWDNPEDSIYDQL